MPARGCALFDTAIGRCGLAWGPHGLLAVQLPEASDEATRLCLLKSAGECNAAIDLPDIASEAVKEIQALLCGEHRSLLNLPLDMARLSEFQRSVYAIARAIPPGRTRTYGDVAIEIGDVKLARAVGRALGSNPFAPVVPCHRILAVGNRAGGFSAAGGIDTKLRLLAIEGVLRSDTLPLFD